MYIKKTVVYIVCTLKNQRYNKLNLNHVHPSKIFYNCERNLFENKKLSYLYECSSLFWTVHRHISIISIKLLNFLRFWEYGARNVITNDYCCLVGCDGCGAFWWMWTDWSFVENKKKKNFIYSRDTRTNNTRVYRSWHLRIIIIIWRDKPETNNITSSPSYGCKRVLRYKLRPFIKIIICVFKFERDTMI